MNEDLRYPIGKFELPGDVSAATRAGWIETVAATPDSMRRAVEGLRDEQLDTPYRPGGWTVRTLVHHVADSHTNAYARFKLTLTEDVPTIRTYDEKRWAELADSKLPIGISLELLDALHLRWTSLMRAASDADWTRRLHHPEVGEMTLQSLLALYAWHGPHHVAHITALREREGW